MANQQQPSRGICQLGFVGKRMYTVRTKPGPMAHGVHSAMRHATASLSACSILITNGSWPPRGDSHPTSSQELTKLGSYLGKPRFGSIRTQGILLFIYSLTYLRCGRCLQASTYYFISVTLIQTFRKYTWSMNYKNHIPRWARQEESALRQPRFISLGSSISLQLPEGGQSARHTVLASMVDW